MAKKKRDSGVNFIICSILSVAAGIAAVVMMFQKWVRVDLFGLFQQQYSVVEVYSGAKELKGQILDFLSEFDALLGQESIQSVPGLDKVETAALAVLVGVGAIILLQAVYFLMVVMGKRVSRPLGILAGLWTTALSVGAIALFCWGNRQLNASLAEWQAALDSFNEMLNSLSGLFGGIENPLLNIKLDANELFQITLFPALTGGLGLIEAILAR